MLVLLQSFVMLAVSQTDSIYSIVNNEIVTKSQYVDSFYSKVYNNITPFTFKASKSVTIGQDVYDINMMRYKGWGIDGGSFEVVEVKDDNGKTLLQLQNSEAWENIDSKLRVFGYYYFIPIKIDATSTALIFVGFIRASQPSFVTIVVLRNKKATLVYNKQLFIASIKSGTIYLSDDAGENDVVHNYRIWVEGGVLKFRED